MSMNAVIDVTIGLMLMYLLLSLVCTIVNEFIGTFLGWRAKNLAQSIERLVDDENFRKVVEGTGVMRAFGKASGGKGPSYIPSRAFALGVVRALGGSQPEASTEKKESEEPVTPFTRITAAIGDMDENSVIRNVLKDLADDAGEDLEKYRRNIAEWFDDVMERAGGVYKRKMKLLSFGVALVVVGAVNGDSIQVAKSLWEDAALRSQITEAAVELVEDTGLADDLADLKAISAELRPLPIGWDYDAPGWTDDWYRTPMGWVTKLFGLLFTAMAVTLGAPFWFDLLGKFTRLRGSGGVPKTQRERDQAKKPATA